MIIVFLNFVSLFISKYAIIPPARNSHILVGKTKKLKDGTNKLPTTDKVKLNENIKAIIKKKYFFKRLVIIISNKG